MNMWNDVKNRLNPSKQRKEKVWQAIEQEIKREERRKKVRLIPLIAAAVIFILAAGAFTPPGQAAISKIQSLFEPEKKVDFEVEGDTEQIESKLHDGTQGEAELADYAIYYDESRYTFEKHTNYDMLTVPDLPETYPDVWMKIYQLKDTSVEKAIQEKTAEMEEVFGNVTTEEVTSPLQATKLHGIAGSSADSPVGDAYIFSNGKDGVFIIETRYFLEAAEGHGARFHAMLETFTIVE